MCIVPPTSAQGSPAAEMPEDIPVPPTSAHGSPAADMPGDLRKHLVLEAFAGTPISHLALEHHVSRKFVYEQLHRAHAGLDRVFDPPAEEDGVLFWLPVTKAWLHQLVLSLVLICHSSFRGVCELLEDVFDYSLSVGSVHNIVHRAITTADVINCQQDLSAICIGANDEIFQGGQPILVGADVKSTYCYLLSPEEHRDGDTWGIRFLELVDNGYHPEATIADFGKGMRKGQEQALPGTPCRGDVFHPLRDFRTLIGQLDNQAYKAITHLDELQQKQTRFEFQHGRKDRQLVYPITQAKREAEMAVALADDVSTLFDWMREDILAVAGPQHATRVTLYNWVVAELRGRENSCERIEAIRKMLENNGDDLLSFAGEMDNELRDLADKLQIPLETVREVLVNQQMSEGRPERRRQQENLKRQLGGKYEVLSARVGNIAAEVVRASSVIENLNSRLRNYFFLRRQVGPGYLKLLRFYLNHRRFRRSEHPQREGKSPRELLTGQQHSHWLELLGFQRFRQQ